jgi:polysaccharide biosynthesis/export protein
MALHPVSRRILTCPLGRLVGVLAVCLAIAFPAAGQSESTPSAEERAAMAKDAVPTPRDYRIGPDDVLSVVFWREEAMSAEVVVRPDGKISLPLIKDVDAAGHTPEELTAEIAEAATKFIARPNVTVIVKAINSRKIFVMGQVAKPGSFPLTGDITVLQALAQAGDVLEYAKKTRIVVVRKVDGPGGKEERFTFNYKDVVQGKHTEQNILLKPGDTVIVP